MRRSDVSSGAATVFFVVMILFGWCMSCAGLLHCRGAIARSYREERRVVGNRACRGWYRTAVFLFVGVWVHVVRSLSAAGGSPWG